MATAMLLGPDGPGGGDVLGGVADDHHPAVLARTAQAAGAALGPDRQQLGPIVVVAAVAKPKWAYRPTRSSFRRAPISMLPVPRPLAKSEQAAVRASEVAMPACTRKSVAWAQTSVSTST